MTNPCRCTDLLRVCGPTLPTSGMRQSIPPGLASPGAPRRDPLRKRHRAQSVIPRSCGHRGGPVGPGLALEDDELRRRVTGRVRERLPRSGRPGYRRPNDAAAEPASLLQASSGSGAEGCAATGLRDGPSAAAAWRFRRLRFPLVLLRSGFGATSLWGSLLCGWPGVVVWFGWVMCLEKAGLPQARLRAVAGKALRRGLRTSHRCCDGEPP